MSISTLSPVRLMPMASLVASQTASVQMASPHSAAPEPQFGGQPSLLKSGLVALAASVSTLLGHVAPALANPKAIHIPVPAPQMSCNTFFQSARPIARQITEGMRDFAGKTMVVAECGTQKKILGTTSGIGSYQLPESVVNQILSQDLAVEKAEALELKMQRSGVNAQLSVVRDYKTARPAPKPSTENHPGCP